MATGIVVRKKLCHHSIELLPMSLCSTLEVEFGRPWGFQFFSSKLDFTFSNLCVAWTCSSVAS